MTGDEHYAKAEALAAFAATCAEKSAPYSSSDEQYVILRDSITVTLAAAQIHATLALAAATGSGQGKPTSLGAPRASAWAVLDAEDRVLAVRIQREKASDYVGLVDGDHIAPLVLVGLDDVAEVPR